MYPNIVQNYIRSCQLLENFEPRIYYVKRRTMGPAVHCRSQIHEKDPSGGGYNYDPISYVRLPFDCHSTALRPWAYLGVGCCTAASINK